MSAPAAKVPSVQRRRKEEMLASFRKVCEGAEGMFIAEYSGADVATLAQLRDAARAAGGEVRVVKNTVARIAISEDERFRPLAEHLHGHILYGSGASAPALAKALRDFAKEHDVLDVRAGAMDGALLEREQIERLASLPSREESLAMLAGVLNAPIVKLARTLAEVPASLARALAAVRDAKAEAGN